MIRATRATSMCVLALAASTLTASAQTPAAGSTRPSEPFRISDNSFLVEEAFNQEPGIFQNIVTVVRAGRQWALGFTQEWPVVSQKHQLSYTVTFADGDRQFGAADTLLNYRYQATVEGPGRPAFSPRASLVLPTGSTRDGRGDGSYGLQINLPFSKQAGDVYWHWNGGFTWLPRARPAGATPASTPRDSLLSPFLSGSAIYRVDPMLHLMLEHVVLFEDGGRAGSRETFYTVSPGLRAGWNVGDQQLVAGAALPITWGGGDTDTGVFLYFSYELPFRR